MTTCSGQTGGIHSHQTDGHVYEIQDGSSRWQPLVEGGAVPHAGWRSSVLHPEGLHASPERVVIDPLFPVGELQQAPGSGDGDAVLRGQARRVAIISEPFSSWSWRVGHGLIA
jgi:hypothetical protein